MSCLEGTKGYIMNIISPLPVPHPPTCLPQRHPVSAVSCMKVKVKATQWLPTGCDPTEYTVRGILQARILEWVAFPFSSRSSQPRNLTKVSCIAGGFFTS